MPDRGSLTRAVAANHQSHNAVQLKTFTRWANSYLAPRGEPVTDLIAQFNSGVLPFRLLEALEVLPFAPCTRGGRFSAFGHRIIATPKLKLQRLENLNAFLGVLTDQKLISLVNIGAEDLEEGAEDLILGLMWALIQHYELGAGQALDAAALGLAALDSTSLLRWVKEQVCDKASPDAELAEDSSTIGWASGFRDGKVLCALVARYRADVLAYHAVERLRPVERAETVFAAAEAEFDVPRLLDAHELASGTVDQLSLVTYVAKLRNALLDTGLAARKRAEAKAAMERAARERAAAEQAEEERVQAERRAQEESEAAKIRAAEAAAAKREAAHHGEGGWWTTADQSAAERTAAKVAKEAEAAADRAAAADSAAARARHKSTECRRRSVAASATAAAAAEDMAAAAAAELNEQLQQADTATRVEEFTGSTLLAAPLRIGGGRRKTVQFASGAGGADAAAGGDGGGGEARDAERLFARSAAEADEAEEDTAATAKAALARKRKGSLMASASASAAKAAADAEMDVAASFDPDAYRVVSAMLEGADGEQGGERGGEQGGGQGGEGSGSGGGVRPLDAASSWKVSRVVLKPPVNSWCTWANGDPDAEAALVNVYDSSVNRALKVLDVYAGFGCGLANPLGCAGAGETKLMADLGVNFVRHEGERFDVGVGLHVDTGGEFTCEAVKLYFLGMGGEAGFDADGRLTSWGFGIGLLKFNARATRQDALITTVIS